MGNLFKYNCKQKNKNHKLNSDCPELSLLKSLDIEGSSAYKQQNVKNRTFLGYEKKNTNKTGRLTGDIAWCIWQSDKLCWCNSLCCLKMKIWNPKISFGVITTAPSNCLGCTKFNLIVIFFFLKASVVILLCVLFYNFKKKRTKVDFKFDKQNVSIFLDIHKHTKLEQFFQ